MKGYKSPADHAHQWAGNLFYSHVSPAEIKEMSFRELNYWNEWYEVQQEALREEIRKRKQDA